MPVMDSRKHAQKVYRLKTEVRNACTVGGTKLEGEELEKHRQKLVCALEEQDEEKQSRLAGTVNTHTTKETDRVIEHMNNRFDNLQATRHTLAEKSTPASAPESEPAPEPVTTPTRVPAASRQAGGDADSASSRSLDEVQVPAPTPSSEEKETGANE